MCARKPSPFLYNLQIIGVSQAYVSNENNPAVPSGISSFGLKLH